MKLECFFKGVVALTAILERTHISAKNRNAFDEVEGDKRRISFINKPTKKKERRGNENEQKGQTLRFSCVFVCFVVHSNRGVSVFLQQHPGFR
jgi:hypothetical protein